MAPPKKTRTVFTVTVVSPAGTKPKKGATSLLQQYVEDAVAQNDDVFPDGSFAKVSAPATLDTPATPKRQIKKGRGKAKPQKATRPRKVAARKKPAASKRAKG